MLFLANKPASRERVLERFGDGRITVTNRMIRKDGEPWLPVMGELHYSRVPCERWKKTLMKMKQSGIQIVASYVFWIHHEEKKGVYDFHGNRDIRQFIALCHELGLEFCLRIGPWAHGECRNGGFPDWLVEECGENLRKDKEPYISYACRFVRTIAEQVRGLELFAIQVENELVDQPDYMEKLRRTVVESGVTAPLFTATGWGNADLPDTVLPMYGGYPEAPWTGHPGLLDPNPNMFFSYAREDNNIGSDLLGQYTGKATEQCGETPYMTCELGGGNQVTYIRRPLFAARDLESLTVCKLGCGVNLLGYYMYCGGSNPIGSTTTQESRATGYWSDYPVISYDFQAPIGDMGQLRESWLRYTRLHQFVHSFGSMLAPMRSVMAQERPADLWDTKTLRCGLRTDGQGGFLFINNHIRLNKLPRRQGEQIQCVFMDGEVTVELDVPEDSSFFIPVNLSLGGLHLAYATAQPVTYDRTSLTLITVPGLEPVAALPDGSRVCLREGVNRIGGTDVILLPYDRYTPSELTPIPVQKRENQIDAQQLMGHLDLEDRTNEYMVRWSEEDTYLVIRAKGNLAGFYADGRLVSDQYLYGDAWVIDLKAVRSREGCIKVLPFREEDRGKIYLEIPFEAGVHTPQVWVTKEDTLFI